MSHAVRTSHSTCIPDHYCTAAGTECSALRDQSLCVATALRCSLCLEHSTKRQVLSVLTTHGPCVRAGEGDGDNMPCIPVQCPLLATEPLAPFGALPVDPFLAEIVGAKCLCPEPQLCGA